MKHGDKLFCLSLLLTLSVVNVSALAEEALPATMKEMWKIIQQQQKEIEALKAKAAQIDALKEQAAPARENRKTEISAAGQVAPAAEAPLRQPGGKAAKTEAERKTDILATEVEKLKTKLMIPETREYKSQYGLGPAASQVYRVSRGLSIGGYGEAFYTDYTSHKGDLKNQFDLERLVLYVGYKFNDWIVLNNEFEWSHASSGTGSEDKGEVAAEFSTLDFLLHRKANIRAGLMLMPMGFMNEIHEPTTFHGNHRPDVETYIIPSTWTELGAGLFGEILPGLQYRMYAVNGLRANPAGDAGFMSTGIGEGKQEGSHAAANDFAFTGRLDYAPSWVPGTLLGGSAYLGDAGQGDRFVVNGVGHKANVFTQLYEGHLQWRYRGFEFRTLGAFGQIGDAGLLSAAKGQTIGKENYGWYTEAAYDIMPLLWQDSTHYLAPFFRYERYNTMSQVPSGFAADRSLDRWIWQGGLTYKPIPNISIKADYRNITSAQGPLPHEFNLGIGFIF